MDPSKAVTAPTDDRQKRTDAGLIIFMIDNIIMLGYRISIVIEY